MIDLPWYSIRRKWLPNSADRYFYSEILQRKLRIHTTNRMMRNLRKMGGFDNYILLTKPHHLDSVYGEYLRWLMLKKLNDPSFTVPYIAKSIDRKKETYSNKHTRYGRLPTIWLPKEVRYEDPAKVFLKQRQDLNRKEQKKMQSLTDLLDNMQDIETSNPLVQEMLKEHEEQMRLVEPIKKEALATWAKFKNTRGKEIIEKMVAAGDPLLNASMQSETIPEGKTGSSKSDSKKK
jgi:large subunit ribosomal protein L28